jgi:hypothetical protein
MLGELHYKGSHYNMIYIKPIKDNHARINNFDSKTTSNNKTKFILSTYKVLVLPSI